YQRGHSFSAPIQVGEGRRGVPRESPFPEVHSFLTRLTGEEAHSRLSRASRNPLLSANQHVAMHSYTFAEERTVYAYPRQVIKCCGMHQDETRREGGKVTETMEKKMESEQSPSIGKDSCPIIETTRHRSTENGKRNPDLHAQITIQQWLRVLLHLHATELLNYSPRMNKRTRDCAPLSPWSTLCTISDIPRESNEYTEADGREAKSESQVGRNTSRRS
ncbi:hypothetical protein ALC57_11847, partial [Trachymyrmex cornetzi]